MTLRRSGAYSMVASIALFSVVKTGGTIASQLYGSTFLSIASCDGETRIPIMAKESAIIQPFLLAWLTMALPLSLPTLLNYLLIPKIPFVQPAYSIASKFIIGCANGMTIPLLFFLFSNSAISTGVVTGTAMLFAPQSITIGGLCLAVKGADIVIKSTMIAAGLAISSVNSQVANQKPVNWLEIASSACANICAQSSKYLIHELCNSFMPFKAGSMLFYFGNACSSILSGGLCYVICDALAPSSPKTQEQKEDEALDEISKKNGPVKKRVVAFIAGAYNYTSYVFLEYTYLVEKNTAFEVSRNLLCSGIIESLENAVKYQSSKAYDLVLKSPFFKTAIAPEQAPILEQTLAPEQAPILEQILAPKQAAAPEQALRLRMR